MSGPATAGMLAVLYFFFIRAAFGADPREVHGINKDSAGHNDTIGVIQGDPDHLTSEIKPVSFDEWYSLGEHGPTEPGDRAPDAGGRRELSTLFTKFKYNRMLWGNWWGKCQQQKHQS